MQKGRSKGIARRGTEVVFGSFGLKALDTKWISSKQLESARRVLLRHFKGKGKIWIRIFPNKPVTSKGAEVGMGGGKGTVDHYVYPIRPGKVIFEVDGVSREIAKSALEEAGRKFSIEVKYIEKTS